MKTVLLSSTLIVAGLSLGGCALSIGDRVVAPPRAAPRVAAATLSVRFEGIETPGGQIMLSIFDNQAAHDQGGAPVRVAAVQVEGSSAITSFEGLAPGNYAIKAFHDVDGDGKMGTNPFGMPIEPFAFSNNAKPEGGPAKWDAARFAIVPGDNVTTIDID